MTYIFIPDIDMKGGDEMSVQAGTLKDAYLMATNYIGENPQKCATITETYRVWFKKIFNTVPSQTKVSGRSSTERSLIRLDHCCK